MIISPEILNRKGARSSKQVPKEITDLLNVGQIETVNLMEALAMDLEKLYRSQNLPELPWDQLRELSWFQQMKAIPKYLFDAANDVYFDTLKAHRSDSLRCWAAGLLAQGTLSIEARLERMQDFADDPHFGVREMAWTHLRNLIIKDLDRSIAYLESWVRHASPNVRRFAIEALRPRGVWCKHIDVLKDKPQKMQHLLEPLKADPSKYVQDSVANWLNDAAKSHPLWVSQLCEQWQLTTDDEATLRICKRAVRSLKTNVVKK